MRERVVKEIRLDRLRANARRIRNVAGDAALFAVVKADAYGHGAVAAARAALKGGARRLCVCGLDEAEALRAAGVPAPILNLEPLDALEVDRVPGLGVVPLVDDRATVRALGAAARRAQRPIAVHLQVETGMGRFGVDPDDALALAEAIRDEPGLALEGAATHLAQADARDASYTAHQLGRFDAALAAVRAAGVRLRYVHAAASVATFRFPAARHTAVRAGIALYGVNPGGIDPAGGHGLAPAMSLRSHVVRVRDLPAGQSISYGGLTVTRRATRAAVVACGYHDGYPLLIGDPGAADADRPAVLIRGQRCPILGRVTMDYVIADVTDLAGVQPGERVTLFGEDGAARLDVSEVARWAGSIPYAVLARLGGRTRACYLDRRATLNPQRRERLRRGRSRLDPHGSHSEIPTARTRRAPRSPRARRA